MALNCPNYDDKKENLHSAICILTDKLEAVIFEVNNMSCRLEEMEKRVNALEVAMSKVQDEQGLRVPLAADELDVKNNSIYRLPDGSLKYKESSTVNATIQTTANVYQW